MPCKFKEQDRVALKSDPKIRGKVILLNEASLPVSEKERYWVPLVRWDGMTGDFMYLEETLILEKDVGK